MERGTIAFTNAELNTLHQLAISQGCQKVDLMQKLQPVAEVAVDDDSAEHTVLLSEDDAEVLLDCMPVPNQEDPELLKRSRIKVQQFLASQRFGEAAA